MSSSFEFRLENSNSAPHLSPPPTLPKHTKQNSLQMNFISLSWLSLFYCAFIQYSLHIRTQKKKKKFFKKISFAFIFQNKIPKLILHDEHSKHVDTLFVGSFRTIWHHFHSFFFLSSSLPRRRRRRRRFRHYILFHLTVDWVFTLLLFSSFYDDYRYYSSSYDIKKKQIHSGCRASKDRNFFLILLLLISIWIKKLVI